MINFPSNPTTGDVYSFQGRIWRWNGVSWRTIASSYSGNVIIIGGSSGNVVSVNGQTGIVTLSTANVAEYGNLYFTNSRAIRALTAGAGISIASNGRITSTATGGGGGVGDVISVNGANGLVNLFVSSPTTPTNPTLGTIWFKSGEGNLFLYINDGNSNIWIEVDTGAADASVASVNGLVGDVILTTSNITEGANLYFSNTRAVSALTAGNGIDIAANGLITGAAQYGDQDAYANTILIGYASNNYVETRLLSKANLTDLTTSNVIEGSNLYFTNTRAVSALTPGTGVDIAANGLISSTALGGVTGINNSNGNVQMYFTSPTVPNANTLGSLWFNPVEGNLSVYISDNTNNFWIEIDQSGASVLSVNGQTGSVVLTTANVAEQSNLYFTNARVYANVIELGYATNSYVNTRLLSKANVADLTTSNVSELTNLYFTNTRSISALTAGTGVDIAANGLITSTAIGGVSSVNGANGNVNLFYASNTAPTQIPLGSLWYKQDQSNIYVYVNDGTSNIWIEIDQGGVAADVNTVNGLTGDVVLTTANIAEQSNLYYTNARVYDNVITLGYSTNVYVNTRLLTKANVADLTTANVTEVTNLYFTNTRAVSALTGGTGIIIDSNGRITSNVTGGGGTASVTSSNTAPASPTEGALWLETDNGDLYIYYSNNWLAVNVPNYIEPVLAVDQFSGNDSTLTYNLSATPANLYYTTVFVDGVYQSKLTYSIVGNSIIFTEAPPTGSNNIEVSTYSVNYLPVTREYKYNKYTANGVGKVYGLQSFGHTNTSILVFENGICQMPEDDYYVSSNAVIFATAPAANVVIQIREMPLT